MSLAPGAKLGPYEIVAKLGEGGMGEVFRARDTRLDRTVAIKILPPDLAADSQFRERFEREARTISSLQHPNICTLFDVGHQDGIDFLVLEFLDGETLSDRLSRTGAIAVPEALRIGTDICDALDRAHRSGIVHRDLKPANVMLTKGAVKLLDFGLAKAAAPAVATSGVSMLPTTPPATVTAQGAILGTFQYMAPEQIEGLEADARTDIFAFGALLYEMVTARKAFEGKTRASLLGAILKDDAPRPSAVQPLASPALDRVVTTCLAKDPDDRYQSARDVQLELKWIATHPSPLVAATPVASRRTAWLPWLLAGVALLLAIAAGSVAVRHLREAPPAPALVRFTIDAPPDTTFATVPGGGTGIAAQLAVSPDGKFIVFVGAGQKDFQLWVRPIGVLDSTALAGTEGASFPFWSPDSRYIGFFAGGKLKKVNVAGGPTIPLCDAVSGRGGTWNRDNVILFSAASFEPLRRVSSAGGTSQPVTTLDTAYGETAQRFPSFLPDGQHFLFTGVVGTCCPATKSGRLRIGSLNGPEVVTLQDVDSSGVFDSGHVLFVLPDGTLMAQPFDETSLRPGGEAFPVAQDVSHEGSRYASVSASSNGLLAYTHGIARRITQLTWMDRNGKTLGTIGTPNRYSGASLSSDERRVAVSLLSGTPLNRDIFIIDAKTGNSSRFTFEPSDESAPIWSPDDSEIAFVGTRDGAQVILRKMVSGSVPEQIVKLPPGGGPLVTDWSSANQELIFNRGSATANTGDVWRLPLRGNEPASPLLNSPSTEFNAVLSPDGRWVAYVTSALSGPSEIFVQPVPPTGGIFQVSREGGMLPVWGHDGSELFFVAPDGRIMVAAIDTAAQFHAGEPVALFSIGSLVGLPQAGRQYSVSKDGRRFLVNLVQDQPKTVPFTVVLNWTSAIER